MLFRKCGLHFNLFQILSSLLLPNSHNWVLGLFCISSFNLVFMPWKYVLQLLVVALRGLLTKVPPVFLFFPLFPLLPFPLGPAPHPAALEDLTKTASFILGILWQVQRHLVLLLQKCIANTSSKRFLPQRPDLKTIWNHLWALPLTHRFTLSVH